VVEVFLIPLLFFLYSPEIVRAPFLGSPPAPTPNFPETKQTFPPKQFSAFVHDFLSKPIPLSSSLCRIKTRVSFPCSVVFPVPQNHYPPNKPPKPKLCSLLYTFPLAFPSPSLLPFARVQISLRHWFPSKEF